MGRCPHPPRAYVAQHVPYPLEPPTVHVAAGDPYSRAGLEAILGRAGFVTVPLAGADVVVWDAPRGGLLPSTVPTVALALDDEAAEDALQAGARGALARGADGDRIAAAVRAVAAGLIVLDPEFVKITVSPRPVRPEAEGLTPREGEVLQLLAEGLSNKEVGSRLGISDHTAKFHVVAILGKLGAASRTEAVVLAARWGLLML